MHAIVTLAWLLGCSGGESNFSNNNEQGTAEQGTGILAYSHETMLFTDLDWKQGISVGDDFLVSNAGDNNLEIYTLDIANSGGGAFFVQEEDNLILAPGNERSFTVVATLYENEPAFGELRVKTNDADARDLRIPLCAYPVDYSGETSCVAEDTTGDTGEQSGGDSGM